MSELTIHDAARCSDVDRMLAMLETDPSLVDADDEHQWRPVFHAALWKQAEAVQLLIDHGADLAAHDGYVMHYAGEIPGNKTIVELLVRYGALDAHTEPRNQRARQFIHAVFLANEARVAAMLRSTAELVHERYARGDTALHHACRNGDLGVARELLRHGADANALSDGRHFPLYCAAGHRHLRVARLLLEHGADPALTMEDGRTVVEWLQGFIENDDAFRRCLDLIAGWRAGSRT